MNTPPPRLWQASSDGPVRDHFCSETVSAGKKVNRGSGSLNFENASVLLLYKSYDDDKKIQGRFPVFPDKFYSVAVQRLERVLIFLGCTGEAIVSTHSS